MLLHEIQHYIQDREGFSEGAEAVQKPHTAYEFAKPGDDKFLPPLYDPLRTEPLRESKVGRYDATLIDPSQSEAAALRLLRTNDEIDALEGGEQTPRSARDRVGLEEWQGRQAQELEESMLVRSGDYGNSAGEWEARTVQDRMNMTPAQRSKSLPIAGRPEGKADTSKQTRDYQQAFDEIMRRAQVLRQIEENWKQRRDIGGGVNAVRISEDRIDYAKNPDQPLVEAKLSQRYGTAGIGFTQEFLDMPFAEQKPILDRVYNDARKTYNAQPRVDVENDDIYDQSIALLARYNPREVAFDPRLYRKEIDQLVKEQFGDEARIIEFIPDQHYVRVTSPEIEQEANEEIQEWQDKFSEASSKMYAVRAAMIEKYGSILDALSKGDASDMKKLNDAEQKYREASAGGRMDIGIHTVDLTPIYGDRLHMRKPDGVDPDSWMTWLAEEQLMANGKSLKGDENIDFEDLVPSQ